MKGYMSPSDHARQVALVKRSLLTKRGPAPAGASRPEHDMRRMAQARVIGR